MRFFLLILLMPLSCFSASLPIDDVIPFFQGPLTFTAPVVGGGLFTNVAAGVASSATNDAVSTLDTTGASLIVAFVSKTNGAPNFQDGTNTYTIAFASGASGAWPTQQVYFCTNNAATSLTFVCSNGGSFGVSAWSCSGTPVFNGGARNGVISGTTNYPGTLNPSSISNLFLTGCTYEHNDSISVDSSFDYYGNVGNGSDGSGNQNSGIAQFVKQSATTENPMWTFGGSTASLASMVMFGVSAGGGGGGTYTLINNAMGNATSTGTASAGPINTTGSKLIVVAVCNYNAAGSGLDANPSDGLNTYLPLTIKGSPSAGLGTNQLFYCINPTTGSSVTFTAKHNYTVVGVECFSYSGGTPTLDTQSAGAGSNSFTTIQPGSATVSSGTGLYITSLTWISGTSVSIDSSFTITDHQQAGSAGLFGAMAYKTSSTAENPTWTVGSGNIGGTTMAVFK